MKNICHGPLESGANILEAEWHDMIYKGAPRGCECGFALIGEVNLDLVVTRETIHEGQSLVTYAIIAIMGKHHGLEHKRGDDLYSIHVATNKQDIVVEWGINNLNVNHNGFVPDLYRDILEESFGG
jgi:hypothetical protein